MSNRAARIASAVFATILTGGPVIAILHVTADAAEGCQTAPGDQTPEGKHWYYRIDHPGNRQCWYLRDLGDRVAQPRSDNSVEAKAETPAPQRSLADARAELPWPQPRVEPNTTSVPQQPQTMPTDAANAGNDQRPNVLQSTTRGSLIGTRWPDPSSAISTLSPQPATPDVVADAQPDQATTAAQPAAPVALASADTTPAKPVGTLQTLLMVIAGALALAGLTASAIFRLGARRGAPSVVRGRRRVVWDTADGAREPQPRRSAPQQSPARMPPWGDPDQFVQRPNLAPGFHEASGPNDSNERLDRISEFLERMSKEPATSVAGSASRERTPTGRPDVRA